MKSITTAIQLPSTRFTIHSFLLACAAAVIFLAPQSVSAYQVLDTKSIKISETAFLYTITYQLGFEKYDISAPVGAVRADLASVDTPYAQFSILEDEEVSTIGAASAFIFSNAEIIDAEYQVPQGESREFMLVGLFTAPAGYTVDEAALQVTSLPFTLTTAGGKVIENGLSQGELSYYRTPTIE